MGQFLAFYACFDTLIYKGGRLCLTTVYNSTENSPFKKRVKTYQKLTALVRDKCREEGSRVSPYSIKEDRLGECFGIAAVSWSPEGYLQLISARM